MLFRPVSYFGEPLADMHISSKLRKVIHYTSLVLRPIGVDFTDRDFKIGARNIFPSIIISCYVVFTVCTIATAESLLMWQCLAMTGLGAQVGPAELGLFFGK
jgi:hypothetical protein